MAKVNSSGTALVYCGFIGGSDTDYGYGIAVDGSGNAYVTGHTYSTEATFPKTVGPDLTHNGLNDAFAAKVNSSGTALVYCGYIGGSSYDYGYGIAVDGPGNAYVTGETSSTEATFPETVGPDLTQNGSNDAFVAKVNSSGTALVYCGYIGGSSYEYGRGIAVDGPGNAYVTGITDSAESTFPETVGPDLTQNGSYDTFVAKVNSSGTALVYCGYLGGSSDDNSRGIAVDGSGNAYVTGQTDSTQATFPETVGPDLTYNGGFSDAFVAKVNSSGTALDYCGYFGGSNGDYGVGIAVDGSGNAYVTGQTDSTQATFPETVGPDLTYNGGSWDAFVAKVSYWEDWTPKHAAGDFDGDGADELAVDFGATGIYLYDFGAWSQISSANPESLLAADMDADSLDEVIADLGASGLWLWNAGAWGQLSGVNVEGMAAGDVDANGADEVVGDFGAVGLWLYNGGVWTQLSGVNADYMTTANVDGSGGAEIIGDFGATGLWTLERRRLDPVERRQRRLRYVRQHGRDRGHGPGRRFRDNRSLAVRSGAWTQMSGVNADFVITANIDGDTDDEIAGDFAATGLWLWNNGAWTILSGANVEFMIRGDVDGDGAAEVAADFGSIGLWLWNAGAWSQVSGVNAEYMLAGDFDGDGADEVMADFSGLGLWLWDAGSWSQASALNPD